MQAALPPGYKTIPEVHDTPEASDCTVMGVVSDYMPPIQSSGPDWYFTLTLNDPSVAESYGTGLKVRVFRSLDRMPQRQPKVGDFLVVRNGRVNFARGHRYLLEVKHGDTEFLFIPNENVPAEGFGAALVSDDAGQIEYYTLPGRRCKPLLTQELTCLMKLKTWAKDGQNSHQPIPPREFRKPVLPVRPDPQAPQRAKSGDLGLPIGAPKKFRYLKDVEVGKYHALVGEVRRKFRALNCLELYVTDYTYHPLLYDYKEKDAGDADGGRDGDPHGYITGDKRQWSGPWGRHTVKITLWPPHSDFAANYDEGDLVYINNARFTQKNDYHMQAAIHEDAQNPKVIHIRKLRPNDPLAIPLLELKNKYWESRDNARKPMSKAEKKKKMKKEKRLAQQRAQNNSAVQATTEGDGESGTVAKEPRDELNKNVRAAHPSQPCIPLSNIVETPLRTYENRHGEEQTIPFVNMKCKTRVRVVDFYPPDLSDFAQCLDHLTTYNDTSSQLEHISPESYPASNSSAGRWEWAFYLLVEDPKPSPGQTKTQLPVLVHGSDAEFLLKIGATDLRYNQEVRSQLKKKLFRLWGNLEELKSSGELNGETKLSNRPFECCIQEFGVEDGGSWRRVHRIFQTTIHE